MSSPEPNQWQEVSCCPLCGASGCETVAYLPGDSYSFGQELIAFPHDGIGITACSVCSLKFKLTIPSPDFLAEIIARQIGCIWPHSCDFSIEKKLIADEIDHGGFDMLDIGASSGGFLASFLASEGRRSALDVVKHPNLEQCLRGEFIHGFIDNHAINWSGNPYDIVVLFDVLEHLYNPVSAFSNLVQMVKQGGRIVIETGDADSIWARRYGVSNWYYAGVFEHHIFWTEKALHFAASMNGLKVNKLIFKRHKYVRNFSKLLTMKLVAKTLLYRLSPSLYYRLGRSGKAGFNVQPASPFIRDHMFMVLSRDV